MTDINNENESKDLIPTELIEKRIYIIRGQKVMLGHNLAELYGVDTKRLNEGVKRNIKRFPPEFMFQLSNQEFMHLKCNFSISSGKYLFNFNKNLI